MSEHLELSRNIEDTISNIKKIKNIVKDANNADEVEFDFEKVIKALEKQIPDKPIGKMKNEIEYYHCPICGTRLSSSILIKKPNYCAFCGQKIDWSDELLW